MTRRGRQKHVNDCCEVDALTRGGGEDTTFEAKEATAKDRVAEYRLPRGQGQKGSRPRTRGYVWKHAQI